MTTFKEGGFSGLNKFKLIKSLDFSKIEQLKAINDKVNNENFFVTEIHGRKKVFIGDIFTYSAESFTNKRERVIATETYFYYNFYYDGRRYRAGYKMKIENQKKVYRLFKWKWVEDWARTWMWGNFDLRTNEGIQNISKGFSDINVRTYKYYMLDEVFWVSDYNSFLDGPEVISSTWNVQRWGGAHGLGVRLIDHVRYERF